MLCFSIQCHKTFLSVQLFMILPIARSTRNELPTKHTKELFLRQNAPDQTFYQTYIPNTFYAYLHNKPDLMRRGFPSKVVDTNKWQVKKRSRLDLVAAKPACPYSTEWKLIYNARDINDTEVTVYQPDDVTSGGLQWFYTATCDRAQIHRENPHCRNCCRGIDHSRFTSNCIPKKSYVMAFIKRRGQTQYEWDWIQINTGCSCAVSDINSV